MSRLNFVWKIVISSVVGITKFKIANTIRYVSIVNLATEDDVKLLKQLVSDFKKINNTLNLKHFHKIDIYFI